MKIVFMGTPDFAAAVLRRLCEVGLEPAVVYAQPPRRQGRGLRVTQPPVARAAAELNLPLRQPEVLQRRAEMAFLEDLAADLIVTAAYGKIFRSRLLALPRLGCINLHPSLLPRYRGLSPIPWAILRGDPITGVTVYRMTRQVDAGPILLQQAVKVRPDDTGHSLGTRLAASGADLICEAIRGLRAGRLQDLRQDAELASFAPRLERCHGRLDWRLPAAQIERTVRAFDPWPGTFCYMNQSRVKILAVEAIDETSRRVAPGTILNPGGKRPPVVATLPGAVALLRVQCENSRSQDGTAFCCGQRVRPGARLRAWPSCPGGGVHA